MLDFGHTEDQKYTDIVNKVISKNLDFGESIQTIYSKFSKNFTGADLIGISSGASDYKISSPTKAIIDNVSSNKNLLKYSFPTGQIEEKSALSIYLNSFINSEEYTPNSIYFTNGATDGIDTIISMWNKIHKNGKVILPQPSYYIFNLASLRAKIPTLKFDIFDDNQIFEKMVESINSEDLVIISNPSNPIGKFLAIDKMGHILNKVQQVGAYILLDRVFWELSFDQKYQTNLINLAQKKGVLDKIIIVDSFSKNMNIPAIRLGYLATTNQSLQKKISKSIETRSCYTSSYLFNDLIFLFALSYTQNKLNGDNSNIIQSFRKHIPPEKFELIKDLSKKHIDWVNKYTSFLKENYNIVKKSFSTIENHGTFNCLISITKKFDHTNYDFTLNLLKSEHLKVQPIEYFGCKSKDKLILRITYAIERKKLIEGINRLKNFINKYNKDNFTFYNHNYS